MGGGKIIKKDFNYMKNYYVLLIKLKLILSGKKIGF